MAPTPNAYTRGRCIYERKCTVGRSCLLPFNLLPDPRNDRDDVSNVSKSFSDEFFWGVGKLEVVRVRGFTKDGQKRCGRCTVFLAAAGY